MNRRWLLSCVLFLGACSSKADPPAQSAPPGGGGSGAEGGGLLALVADVDLPGAPARFDYQDLDASKGNLVIAHMNDASVVVVKASDGSVVKAIPGVPTARGVAVAADVGRVFVTSSPNKLVIFDNDAFGEIARVDTGSGPDGVGWDPSHKIVGVSDQRDGVVSLLADAGTGARRQVPLGSETGNVVFDASRGAFWVTVVGPTEPDRLVAIDPVGAQATTTIVLPGCSGAHGLRLHPDGKSAFVACEENARVVRVDLVGEAHALAVAPSGKGPDVMAIDPGLGRLYVAAESGDLTVFDIGQQGLVTLGTAQPGDASHSVAVDPATHYVFFPLSKGPKGTPVLRIMKPSGA